MKELKFKPGQIVVCVKVRDAGAVGYLGTYHKIYDYIAHPSFLKKDNDGVPLYPCVSEKSGFLTWFYEDELT